MLFASWWPAEMLAPPLRAAVKVSTAAAAQLMVSATSVTLSFALIHVLSVEGYATYVLAAAAALFASGFVGATFVSRFAVAVGSLEDDGSKVREIRHAVAVALCAGMSVVVVGAAVSLVRWDGTAFFAWLFCGLTLVRDAGVRITNAANRVQTALTVAAVFSVLALACAVFPAWRGITVSVGATFAGLSVAVAASLVALLAREGIHLRGIPSAARDLWRWVGEVIRLRDWLATGFVVIWLQAQAILFIVSHELSSAGVAALGATRLFSSPLVFLSQALGPVVIAKIAARSRDRARVTRQYVRASAVFALCYVIVVVPSARAAAGLLFPRDIPVTTAVLATSVTLGALQFVKDAVRYGAIAARLDRHVWVAAVCGLILSGSGSVVIAALGMSSLPMYIAMFCAGEVLSAFLLLRRVISSDKV